jgi:rhodanese-related sulfurtransferase
MMQHLRPAELKAWLDDPERPKPLLLDVREGWEFERCHLQGATPLPMSTMQTRVGELDSRRETVVICHHGVRSFHVARFLEHNGFDRVINLTGGVDAWAKEVDPAMPTY